MFDGALSVVERFTGRRLIIVVTRSPRTVGVGMVEGEITIAGRPVLDTINGAYACISTKLMTGPLQRSTECQMLI